MQKPLAIETLASEVIDQIAAGEVVERPAHLVKELVENSLDSGATQIAVEFAQGGRFVIVSDNGSGIAPEDLAKALDRHATSKIRASEDLWKLQSFGFRGEALASIAAVSRLTLTSRRADQSFAAHIQSHFGHRSGIEHIGGSPGTRVRVEELFENVPARLKFMKSAAAESSRIKQVLKALALAHPSVEIKVTQDGELVFFWTACTSRLERVRQILGIESLYEGRAERGSVTAEAIFADPQTVQKTGKDLWFFAQGRWIQDRSLQAAVMEAYRHLLMHGEYPLAVVWLECDPENIDVNIHPTKSQVKFVDPSMAFRAVQAAIRSTLEQAPWLGRQMASQQPNPAGSLTAVEQATLNFSEAELERTHFSQKSWQLQTPLRSHQAAAHQKDETSAPQDLSSPALAKPAFKSVPMSEEPVDGAGGAYWSSLQVLSQTNLTYILTQTAQSLLIIDQHAAHERVLFEKLMKAWRGGKLDVQEFLFPLAVDLSAEKVEALVRERDSFLKLGIQLEALGPETIGVTSAPTLLKESALHRVLEKMSQDLVDHGGSHYLERKVGDLLATLACHSAVRAGQAMSLEEMTALLKQMDEFPLSSFCPHGRPVSVEYPFYQLEKDFGRIV
jgi:DNA mismatch repair protein MutL